MIATINQLQDSSFFILFNHQNYISEKSSLSFFYWEEFQNKFPQILNQIKVMMMMMMMDNNYDSDDDFLGSCYKEGVSCGSKGKGGQKIFVS